MNGLYHKELGMPVAVTKAIAAAKERKVQIPLQYSEHARKAANDDRYGRIRLPKELNVAEAEVIEVEVKDNAITKIVFRTAYDEAHDIAIVVLMKNGLVKTVWLNTKGDAHKTLNASRYAKVQ